MKKIILMFIAASLIGTAQAQTTKKRTTKPAVTTAKPAAKPAENTAKAQPKQAEAQKPAPKPQPKPAPEPEVFAVKGANLVNAGVGLGTYYVGLPFGISYEHGFTDEISGGVFVDYSSHKYDDFYGDNSKLTIVYAGVRASYHFAKLFQVKNKNFDPYAGASLGYHHIGWSYDGAAPITTPYDNSIFFGVHGGVRYLLSDHVGGFAEVGYGVAALKLGVTLKF